MTLPLFLFMLLPATGLAGAGTRESSNQGIQESSGLAELSNSRIVESSSPAESVRSNPLQSETWFLADTAIREYRLADRFIFMGTDSVWVNDSLLSEKAYRIDYSAGTIAFPTPMPESSRIRVTYQHLPATGLKNAYYHRLEPGETANAVLPESAAASGIDTSQVQAGALALNGAKTFTVGFGSSGLDLDQSLRLNLKGTIAGVEIDAALSDQGAGVNAEGTTQELSELDRVLINLHGSHLSGSLGDIDFQEPQGRLGQITRQLRGADAAWYSMTDTSTSSSNPGARVEVSYARPKGRYGHNEFNGTDGKQGPYLLTGDISGILIVSGSERVYLDGRQLVRGWDQDYTIDYDLGELTFTNRNQIAATSRIEADFEYTTDEYDRTMLTGRASYDFGPAHVTAGAFTESDDKNSHLGRTFTGPETDTLALAGDTTAAWLSGADSVGPGNGDYVRNGNHFDFAGRDSGNFSVRFTLLGDSSGDYVYDNSIAAWRFVGPGNGNYVARQQVRMPERSEAYHVDVAYRPLPGMDLELTGMLTRLSRNLFAAIGLRNGLGYDGTVGWQRDAGGVRYERRSLGTGFSFPALVGERDFDYTWGLAQVPAVYTRDQVSGYLKPWTPVRLDATAGWLRSQPDGLDRKRASFGASAWFADYTLERIGSLTRHSAELQPKIGSFYPAVQARYEDDTLHRLLETQPELGWKPSDKLQLKLSWQRTQQQESRGQGFRESRDFLESSNPRILESSLLNIYRADGSLVAVRNLDVEAIGGFQQQKGYVPGILDWNQLFANLVSSYTNPAGVRARVSLDQKYKQEAAKQEIFVSVTPGKGAYSRNPETGDYYPDTLGSYNQVLVNSGKTIPTRQTNLDFSAGLASSRWFNLDLSGQLDQEASDTGTMLNNWSGTTSLELLPYSKAISATVAENVNSSFDRLFSSLPEHDFRNQASLELRTSASDHLTGKASLEMPYTRQLTETGQLKQEEIGLQGYLKPVIGSGLDLELTGGYGVRSISLPLSYPSLGRFQVRTLTLGANRRFEFLHKTALTADVQVDRRDATISRLPFEIQLTDPLGWSEELTLNLDRMLGSILVLSGDYTFRKRPDRAAEHDLSVSLKAYF